MHHDVATVRPNPFRRDYARDPSILVKPKGLAAKKTYKVEFVLEHAERKMAGDELSAGIDIFVPAAPGTALIIYSWT